MGSDLNIQHRIGVIHKKVGPFQCGMRPPAQAPPHRGFCPGGRALWLGEIAGCGVNKKKNE